jgi:hypothetical protein
MVVKQYKFNGEIPTMEQWSKGKLGVYIAPTHYTYIHTPMFNCFLAAMSFCGDVVEVI